MKGRRVLPALLAVAALLTAAACAPPMQRRPPQQQRQRPEPRPASPRAPVATPAPAPRAQPAESAARAERALALQNQGDLAAAYTQWRILCTLDPHDAEVQRQLAATRALIRHRVEQALAAGAAAEEAGDTAAARDAYLRALALEPREGPALENLRRLETAADYERQEARLTRLRERRDRAARTAGGATGAPASSDGQERDYREMGVALFQAGDYAASILELQKYLGAFPDDRAAGELLRQARQRTQGSPPPEGAAQGGASAASPGQAGATPPAAISAANAAAAQEFYDRGLRVYRHDIGAAIRLWGQALERDPGHVQARLHLDQARRMQQSLKLIDQQ